MEWLNDFDLIQWLIWLLHKINYSVELKWTEDKYDCKNYK